MKIKVESLKATSKGVYEDGRGRTFIGDKKKNKLYLIDKEDMKRFTLYQSRISIPLTILVTAGILFEQWVLGVILAVGSLALLEYMYRNRFLTSLESIDYTDFPTNDPSKEKLSSDPVLTNVIRVVLGLALPILLVVNLGMQTNNFADITSNTNNIILLVTTVLVGLYALYIVCKTAPILFKQLKNK